MEAVEPTLGSGHGARAAFELDGEGRYLAFDAEHRRALALRDLPGPELGAPLVEAVQSAARRAPSVREALEEASERGTSVLLIEERDAPPLRVRLYLLPELAGERRFLGLHPVEPGIREMDAQREELARLADGVLNELNNLAVGLGGAGEALRGEPNSGTWAELLQDVRGRMDIARRLARVIRSAAMPAPVQVVHLDELLRELEPDLRRAAPESGLQLEAGAPHARLRADAGELGDALRELVKNAHDAEARRVVIRSRPAEPAADGAPMVAVELEDDGQGLQDGRGHALFDLYVGTRSPGQGMGLTRARAIARGHGGHLRLASRRGGGTVATLLLPVTAGSSLGDGHPSAGVPEHLDVFVVDDAPEVRRVLGRVLRHAGHRVSEAEDGLDALEKLDAADRIPDVIVLDLMMPRMDGVETYRALRARTAALPILITSGYHPSSLGFLSTDPKASFLPKPFSPAEVITALDTLLRS
jgi:CheY-like chemotaxis protein/signal transduction histidine kinase